MKKLYTYLVACVMLISCSKDKNKTEPETGGNLSTAPTAKVTYDNKNYGIYKGVFVGSTGNVLINFKNDGTTLSANFVIDSKLYTYTSNSSTTEGTNSTITFRNNNDYFDFTVNADGSNPTIANIHISGHSNAIVRVLKEASNAQVYCFEGTFTEQGGNGTLNLVIKKDKVEGLFIPADFQVIPPLKGSVTNNNITAGIGEEPNKIATITGVITEKNIKGNWSSDTGSGSWEAHRTL
ncbi:MAG: hypothetical protein J7623_12205 [Chitinophaga sp.]|uniref:hypothetical protein n=1 Tax=Chitinophaga sp. TaxID=1869181 RepID=UPI001B0021E3|nr:hypothetical protein [Chitinophaga sp.]MBO9729389.1 hypothetical protein [Chitinophaga sp.]